MNILAARFQLKFLLYQRQSLNMYYAAVKPLDILKTGTSNEKTFKDWEHFTKSNDELGSINWDQLTLEPSVEVDLIIF